MCMSILVSKKKNGERNITPATFETNNLLTRVFNYLKFSDDVFLWFA